MSLYDEGLIDGYMVGYSKNVPIDYIKSFTATEGMNNITLNWTYNSACKDFSKVVIVRTINNYATDILQTTNNAVRIYDGSSNSFVDSVGLVNGTTYYYRIFVFNTNGDIVGNVKDEINCVAKITLTRYKLYFNGSNTYISIPYSPTLYSLFNTGNYTIIIKFNIESLLDSSLSARTIMQMWHGASAYNNNNTFILQTNTFLTKYQSNAYQTMNFSGISPNTDMHLSIIGDNSGNDNKVSILNDGNILASQAGMKSDAGDGNILLRLGTWYYTVDSSWRNFFKGTMQEVQIWNRTLTDTENLSYSQKSPIENESGLLLYYDFSEGSGTTLINKGLLGSVCNGVIINGIWQSL